MKSKIIFSLRRISTTFLLFLCVQTVSAQWGEEWLYCPSGVKIEYTYATIGGVHETFPLGFGLTLVQPFLEHNEFDKILAFSYGIIAGGNWKNQHFTYREEDYDYELNTRFYWMGTVGIESGFMALQVGLGLCAAEYSKAGATIYRSDGVYYTPKEFHKRPFFMVEPAAYFYIPITEGYKIPIKIGYQFVPAAPIMNGLVIGGGIRLAFDNDN